MGRTVTFCRSHNISMDWPRTFTERAALDASLQQYLNEPACVAGAPKDARVPGTYLDELTRGLVSVLKLELRNHVQRNTSYVDEMASFGVIFSELCRLAASISPSHATNSRARVSFKAGVGAETVDGDSLQDLNTSAQSWSAQSEEEEAFASLATNLADSYLKALEEYRIVCAGDDVAAIRHHGAALGDIMSEILALHATLLPLSQAEAPGAHQGQV